MMAEAVSTREELCKKIDEKKKDLDKIQLKVKRLENFKPETQAGEAQRLIHMNHLKVAMEETQKDLFDLRAQFEVAEVNYLVSDECKVEVPSKRF